MNKRIKRFCNTFRRKPIEAFLVTNDVDISYLTGLPSRESCLFVTPKKSYYLTDFRYFLEAKKELKGIAVRKYQKSICQEVACIAQTQGIKAIGFDDRHLSLRQFQKIQEALKPTIRFLSCSGLVEEMRMVKDRAELSVIRKAIKLNLEAFGYIKPYIKKGVSEFQIKDHLSSYVKEHGVAFSFDPIIASGSNSCFPHAKVTRRKFRSSEIILIDMGIEVNGYKSDLTRMFFLGKIPQLAEDVLTFVRAAQRQAIQAIRPGVSAKEVDHQARNYLRKKKLGHLFGHSLGHGVGLDIHESPTISSVSTRQLKENMIFTVEPAVYIPHQFGIRIEDMVLVTKNGCEVLSDNIH